MTHEQEFTYKEERPHATAIRENNLRKTRITVTIEGCHGCGARWSGGWGKAKEILIQIGNQTGTLELPLCAKCIAQRNEQLKLR